MKISTTNSPTSPKQSYSTLQIKGDIDGLTVKDVSSIFGNKLHILNLSNKENFITFKIINFKYSSLKNGFYQYENRKLFITPYYSPNKSLFIKLKQNIEKEPKRYIFDALKHYGYINHISQTQTHIKTKSKSKNHSSFSVLLSAKNAEKILLKHSEKPIDGIEQIVLKHDGIEYIHSNYVIFFHTTKESEIKEILPEDAEMTSINKGIHRIKFIDENHFASFWAQYSHQFNDMKIGIPFFILSDEKLISDEYIKHFPTLKLKMFNFKEDSECYHYYDHDYDHVFVHFHPKNETHKLIKLIKPIKPIKPIKQIETIKTIETIVPNEIIKLSFDSAFEKELWARHIVGDLRSYFIERAKDFSTEEKQPENIHHIFKQFCKEISSDFYEICEEVLNSAPELEYESMCDELYDLIE
jgi:hypothetical protein